MSYGEPYIIVERPESGQWSPVCDDHKDEDFDEDAPPREIRELP